jgi:hypothetical protein
MGGRSRLGTTCSHSHILTASGVGNEGGDRVIVEFLKDNLLVPIEQLRRLQRSRREGLAGGVMRCWRKSRWTIVNDGLSG